MTEFGLYRWSNPPVHNNLIWLNNIRIYVLAYMKDSLTFIDFACAYTETESSRVVFTVFTCIMALFRK